MICYRQGNTACICSEMLPCNAAGYCGNIYHYNVFKHVYNSHGFFLYGKDYEELIGIAFSVCEQFYLVKRHELVFNTQCEKTMDQFSGSLISVETTWHWPGTDADYADIYIFTTSDEAKSVVLNAVNNLYG